MLKVGHTCMLFHFKT